MSKPSEWIAEHGRDTRMSPLEVVVAYLDHAHGEATPPEVAGPSGGDRADLCECGHRREGHVIDGYCLACPNCAGFRDLEPLPRESEREPTGEREVRMGSTWRNKTDRCWLVTIDRIDERSEFPYKCGRTSQFRADYLRDAFEWVSDPQPESPPDALEQAKTLGVPLDEVLSSNDGIIRAAEGVGLEPGEYEVVEIHPDDSAPQLLVGSRFREATRVTTTNGRWVITHRNGSNTWLTAVRRVEAQPERTCDCGHTATEHKSGTGHCSAQGDTYRCECACFRRTDTVEARPEEAVEVSNPGYPLTVEGKSAEHWYQQGCELLDTLTARTKERDEAVAQVAQWRDGYEEKCAQAKGYRGEIRGLKQELHDAEVARDEAFEAGHSDHGGVSPQNPYRTDIPAPPAKEKK